MRHARFSGLLPLAVLSVVLLAAILGASGAGAQTGLRFNGSNSYVTFGRADSLGVARFTVETWFRREGAGATVSTGTGGVTAVPLVTKGRGEADASTLDMNFFLGIRATDNVLVADYEEGTGQTSPGLNHPIAGVTRISNDTWHHAAVTFDGTTLRLYLNGNFESEVIVGANRLPQSASLQHAALASALSSTGAAAGYFLGTLDEARVWNRARTAQAVRDSMTLELTSAPGLRGRWGLNEGSGTVAANSVATGPNGTLTNAPVWVSGTSFLIPAALRFGGTNDYVTFGTAPGLGLGTFTLETWFRRDGTGVAANTGTGGFMAIPLVTKGVGEAEGSTVDMNYFLGIHATTSVLVADFEEGAGGASPGLNHPVSGVTPIVNGVWYHAAVTYDGTTWNLYLNGALETSLAVGRPPQSASIQHAGLGTALNSTGTASGFFFGALDEVRIWDHARTGPEIGTTINSRLTSSQTGLVGLWNLDEASGNAVHASAGTTIDGTLQGTGWGWVAGAPFNAGPPTPPDAPSALLASAAVSSVVQLTWTDNSDNETAFAIERSTTGSGGPFTPAATVPANTTTWNDPNRSAYAEYCYRVRATNTTGTSEFTDVACATTPGEMATALDFTGTNGYVTFGPASSLGLGTFTIETWFRRDGAGATTTTGTGGIPDGIPLLSKGRGEAEGGTVDMNYFLGIDQSDSVLVADFEEGAGTTPGLNHPVSGTTKIQTGVWYHAAATYDGTTWCLYLNGSLEATLLVGQPPQSASIQHAGLATAMTSTGAVQGFFDGALDEARVWSYARSQSEIRTTINQEIATAQTGLVARWSLNEGSGTLACGSAGTLVNGSVSGSGWAWGPGAPFDIVVNDPPTTPTNIGPADGATDVTTTPTLEVGVSDPEGDSLTVNFYGRPVPASQPADFTLVMLPDSQYYSAGLYGGTPAMFQAQTQWVVANRVARNIVYVAHVGDFVESGDNAGNPVQWQNLAPATALLEDPLTTQLADGIPFGIAVGNHDQSPNGDPNGTTSYNQFYGTSRFAGRSYYGGHHGTDNDNHFNLFSASGFDFIAIHMEYATAPAASVLDWADSLLAAYPARRAIVVSHWIMNGGTGGSFGTQGQAIYDALKDRSNLFLMLCGHVPDEGQRTDNFAGNTVFTILADYQSRTNGGNGWLRLLEFSPANNEIRAKTYSPVLDQWETDANSQFVLPYAMSSVAGFELIGTVTGVASGATASVAWPGLSAGTEYEWYAVVSDAEGSTTGPTWRFTTSSPAFPLTVSIVGSGTVTRDPDAAAYPPGTPVQLQAIPDAGFAFGGWSGDANGTDNPITVTMTGALAITATFTDVQAPSVQVLGPNGTETLQAYTTATLTWSASDNVGVTSVDIAVSRSGPGGPFEDIALAVPNTGQYEWPVTAPGTTDAWLRVTARDAAALAASDTSNAAFTILATVSGTEEGPVTAFALRPVLPNPSRHAVQIAYAVPRDANVSIRVLDVRGRTVAVLVDGPKRPGRYSLPWSATTARDLSAGVYFVQMQAGGERFTQRFTVLR